LEGKGEILVALAEARVYVENVEVKLTARENDVLTALAVSRKPLSTDALLERVWPDQDPQRTRLSLKVYVHRLRRRLRNPAVVVCDRSLWSLGPQVHVDVLEWQKIARLGSPQLTETHLAVLHLAYDKLVFGVPDALTRSPLLASVEYLLQQSLFDVSMRIIDDALERKAFGKALSIAREMSLIDAYSAPMNERLSNVLASVPNHITAGAT
jgi:DNA-binding SARP family transcriptional activator